MKERLPALARRLDVSFKSMPIIGPVAHRVEVWASGKGLDRVGPNLYISNHATAQQYHEDFAVTVSVGNGANNYPIDYYYPLEVHDTNQYGLFADAVDTVRAQFRTGARTLVHCHEGRERAPSVVITALAAENEIAWAEACENVKGRRELIEPPRELRQLGVKYLHNHGVMP